MNEELMIGSDLSPSFQIIDDQIVEPIETFLLTLTSNSSLVDVTTPNVTIYIVDNERRKYHIQQNLYLITLP